MNDPAWGIKRKLYAIEHMKWIYKNRNQQVHMHLINYFDQQLTDTYPACGTYGWVLGVH